VRSADLELAKRCCNGDAAAFEELYRTHAGRLYGVAFRMAGSAQEAEDLLQEMFLHAHRKLGTFRGESSLGTWLYRLGMNQCLDYLRGKQARMSQATDSLDAAGAGEVAQESLFGALRSKVALLQETLTLINEMRKGNQEGAARIVSGLNQ